LEDTNPTRAEERLERAMRLAGTGAWELILPARLAWFDEGLRALLGVDERVLPDALEALEARVHPEDLDRLRSAIERQVTEPGAFSVEFRARGRDGRFAWFHAIGGGVREAVPREDGARADGALEVGTVRVAGLLRRADLRREPGRDGASTARASFLAAMSHEIRTPMTAILGFADLLRDAAISSPDVHAAAEAIHRNGEHLLKIVNDILDISRIEAGAMTLEEIAVSPIGIATEVVDSLRPRAVSAGIDVTVELLGPVPSLVRSDPTRLRQILFNLVDNAIKFTEHGFVRVGLERGPGESLRIHVSDTGIGVSPEHIDQIFRPFVQGDPSMVRRYGGTGLGLDISRRLARLLGGEISVRSTSGRGSTFTVEVATGPLAGVPLVSAIDVSDAAKSGMTAGGSFGRTARVRVLLAEDGADNQRLLRHHLEREGMSVTAVDNGRAAVETMVAALRHGAGFDLVLMDMQMPELDGPAATRALREAGFTGPIIALTAHDVEGLDGARERCVDAGCDDVLAKPIERQQLFDAIRRHLANAR